MITRLVEFYPGTQCASTEMRDFANVSALVEWLKDLRARGFLVRVIC